MYSTCVTCKNLAEAIATLKINCFVIILLIGYLIAAVHTAADIRIENALDKCQQITQQVINLAPIPI
jgi:hypothetical protein